MESCAIIILSLLLACDHVNQFVFSLNVILRVLFGESICIDQS